MRRFLLLVVLGAWLLWACAAPPTTPAATRTPKVADTIVVYKAPT